MRFISRGQGSVISDQGPANPSPTASTGHCPTAHRPVSVKLSSLPIGPFFTFQSLLSFARLGLFLSGFENALLVAANTFVRVQAFEHEFCGRDLLLRALFLRDAEGAEFVGQSLDFFQV